MFDHFNFDLYIFWSKCTQLQNFAAAGWCCCLLVSLESWGEKSRYLACACDSLKWPVFPDWPSATWTLLPSHAFYHPHNSAFSLGDDFLAEQCHYMSIFLSRYIQPQYCLGLQTNWGVSPLCHGPQRPLEAGTRMSISFAWIGRPDKATSTRRVKDTARLGEKSPVVGSYAQAKDVYHAKNAAIAAFNALVCDTHIQPGTLNHGLMLLFSLPLTGLGACDSSEEIVYRGALTGNSSSPTHVMFTADAQFLAARLAVGTLWQSYNTFRL